MKTYLYIIVFAFLYTPVFAQTDTVITARDDKKDNTYKEVKARHLKEDLDEAYLSCDFDIASKIIDSLERNYGIRNDPAITVKKDELALFNSILGEINREIKVKRYEDATDLCDIAIKKQKHGLLLAECYYLRALANFKRDSNSSSKILKDLNTAIDSSGQSHNRAFCLRATVYKNERKYDLAMSDALFLINHHSADPRYYKLRASIREASNHKDDAIADYNLAIKNNTTDSTVYISKARLEYETNKNAEAVRTASQIIEKTNCVADAFYYRALAYEKLNDFSAAGKDYFKAVSCGLSADKQNNFHTISTDHYNRGKRDSLSAMNEFTNSILLDSNSNALFYRALIYHNLHNDETAEANLSILIKRDGNYENAYYQRGLIRKDAKDAINDFRNELTRHPENKEAYAEIAKTEMGIGDYKAAGKHAAAAARKFKDNDYLFQVATEAYYRANLPDSVIRLADLAEQLKSRHSAIYYFKGRALHDQGKYTDAMIDFNKALAMNVNYIEADYWEGRIYMRWDKYKDAIESFNKALLSSEFKADVNFYLGRCKLKNITASYTEAIANFKNAIDLDEKKYKKAETYSWIAYAHLRLNDEQANLSIPKSLDPTDAAFYFVSACELANNKSFDEALNCFESALKNKQFNKENMEDEKEYFYSIVKKDSNAKRKYKDIMDKYYK